MSGLRYLRKNIRISLTKIKERKMKTEINKIENKNTKIGKTDKLLTRH